MAETVLQSGSLSVSLSLSLALLTGSSRATVCTFRLILHRLRARAQLFLSNFRNISQEVAIAIAIACAWHASDLIRPEPDATAASSDYWTPAPTGSPFFFASPPRFFWLFFLFFLPFLKTAWNNAACAKDKKLLACSFCILQPEMAREREREGGGGESRTAGQSLNQKIYVMTFRGFCFATSV